MQPGGTAKTSVGHNLVPISVKTSHKTLNHGRTAKMPVSAGAATH